MKLKTYHVTITTPGRGVVATLQITDYNKPDAEARARRIFAEAAYLLAEVK